jgi:hypothetical protein
MDRGVNMIDLNVFLKNNQSNLVLTKKIFLKNSISFKPVFYPRLAWVFNRVKSNQSFYLFFLKLELVHTLGRHGSRSTCQTNSSFVIRVIIVLLILTLNIKSC